MRVGVEEGSAVLERVKDVGRLVERKGESAQRRTGKRREKKKEEERTGSRRLDG